MTQQELCQRLETLVTNAVQGSANRVNEAANIIGAMSKDENIQSAFVSIKDAVKDFDETMSELGSRRVSRKRPSRPGTP